MCLVNKYLGLCVALLLLVGCRPSAPLELTTREGETPFDIFVRLANEFPPTDDSLTVVLNHSLANEGLHEQGARALLSYRENMPRIIDTLQLRGYRVVLVKNTPADNFCDVDIADMEEVNAEMDQWLR